MRPIKPWAGQTPQRCIAIKLDGIQALLSDDGTVVSRAGKPLYNVDPRLLSPGKRYEVFLGSFALTSSALKTHDHTRKVRRGELYEIWPGTDPRLVLPIGDVAQTFERVVADGFEGLVIDQAWKVKKHETYDVAVTAVLPGKGKHEGRMGALVTERGKVGTGFTDRDREHPWQVGDIIEVRCMELTAAGKFRKPRFVRHRWDKENDRRHHQSHR